MMLAHFRTKRKTHQDDNPHRVVGEQQQAEGHKTEADHLICSCGLKTKRHLSREGMNLAPVELQTSSEGSELPTTRGGLRQKLFNIHRCPVNTNPLMLKVRRSYLSSL